MFFLFSTGPNSIVGRGNINLSLGFLDTHKELLFNSAKPITPTNFLKLVIKVYANSEADIALQGKLLKEVLDKADINDATWNYMPGLAFFDRYKELLFGSAKPITAENFLKVIISTYTHSETDIALQGKLLKYALDKGADINTIVGGDDFYPFHLNISPIATHKDFLFNSSNPITASNLLKLVLNTQANSEADIALQGELLKEALDKGAKFSDTTMHEFSNTPHLANIFRNKELLFEHPTNPLPIEILIRSALRSMNTRHYINGELEVNHEKIKQQREAITYAVKKGANLNYRKSSDEFSLYENLFRQDNFDILDLVQNINPQASYPISTPAWFQAISGNYNIGFIVNALQRFPAGFSKDEANDLLRAHGGSHSSISAIFDIYDLARDVAKVTAEQNSTIFSNAELEILDISRKNVSFSALYSEGCKNSYEFSLLSLALLAGRFELAIEMIEAGASLTEKNKNGVTPIQILGQLIDDPSMMFLENSLKTLTKIAFEKLDNVDVLLNDSGETLIDNFLNQNDLKEKALEKTNDPLFSFYKPNANLFSPSLHPELIHIAISMGEGFWSTGLNSVSRLISREHSDVVFHLVTLEMMEEGGNRFISQFNGWINPGAGDSFPRGKSEFNKNDWGQSMLLERAYQMALSKTYELKIPYIGMCAGAQNLALYHDGYLHKLDGYDHGKHSVTYIKGTLPHFMAMIKEQQEHALQHCEFPEINFKGDTAHHYAAVSHKLGNGLQLGAVSEDGVAMSYAHENGLRYATQFHPEHYYSASHVDGGGANHQEAWLENFIHLTRLHHSHNIFGSAHPEAIFEHISERLAECMKAPSCLAEENKFNTSSFAMLLFDH